FVRDLSTDLTTFLTSLGDTDDATRLIEVRRFLAGAGWFDLSIPQYGSPEILISHWSRLIDVPLAAMIAIFTPFLGSDGAETATRLAWPALTLFAMSYLVLRETTVTGGWWAGLIVAGLIVAGPMALYQFLPGRIDHHNVQILTIAGGLLLMQRAMFQPRAGYFAGAMLGVGLAIGYEALVLTAAVIGVAALMACFVKEMRDGLNRVIVACTLTVTAVFIATTAPSNWASIACDALSLNLVVLLGCGAIASSALYKFARGAGPVIWISGFAVGGAAGLALYAGVEPACLAGPFGAVDPRVKPIWLDQVLETQSLIEYSKSQPMFGIAYAATALLLIAVLAHKLRTKVTPSALFHLALVVLTVAYGCIYFRLVPYAMWIVLPGIAIWISQLRGIGETPARTIQLAALVFLNQTTMLLAVNGTAIALMGSKAADKSQAAEITGCQLRAPLRELAKLEPGLVVANLDLGPHIAAHAPHRVLAAPYHRLDKGILKLYEILEASPAKAEKLLRASGASYVVICTGKGGRRRNAGSFRETLRQGKSIDYLEPVKLGDGTAALKAWRLKDR
ncbi:MAG TPA: hypothetical protein VMX97_04995, partial [Hyphomicrobiaceae bacterium]|nr:hypothetical protein [Hyphomicrobiaceae bacterium]